MRVKRIWDFLIPVVMLVWNVAVYAGTSWAEELFVFCGAAFKKPMDEIINLYEKRTGIKVYATYGGVRIVLSQALLTKQGDVFVVPSPHVMDIAVKKGLVLKKSIRHFSYMVPVIVVPKGNPQHIKGLKDLLRPEVRFAMGNPESVYIGMLAAEIFDRNLSPAEVEILRKKVLTYAENISRLFTYLIMNQVDAILGFDFLKGWNPHRVDVVKLKKEEIIRIGAGEAGLMTTAKNPKEGEKFIKFLSSKEGQRIFKKYGYLATEKEAFAFVGKRVTVGGEPEFSRRWLKR